MALVWKVDVGLVNNPGSGSLNLPKSLSDITFYDSDVPFTILEGEVSDLNYVSSNVKWPYTSPGSAAGELYDYLFSKIGSNADVIYLLPFRGSFASQLLGEFSGTGGEAPIVSAFPSAPRSWPNTITTIKNNNIDYPSIAVYFKSLKKLFLLMQPYPYQSSFHVMDTEKFSDLYAWNGVSSTADNRYSYYIKSGGGGTNPDVLYPAIIDRSRPFTADNIRYVRIYGKSIGTTYPDKQYHITTVTTHNNNTSILQAIFGNEILEPDKEYGENPYEPGGDSGPGDLPPGTFDDTSDPIPDSSLPTISASDTGFTTIYNPTLSQLRSLARYLWTEPDILTTIWNHVKQIFEDPMDALISLSIVPCAVPDGGTRNFQMLFIDTGVPLTIAANQFIDVDCGTVTLDRYYGSALDQNPYTKVACFLPYIGTVHLNTDEVMGTTLQVKYRIDIASGVCVAKIFVDGSCLYQYSGSCAIQIPFSSAEFSSYVSALIGVGAAIVGLGAAAGAGAAAGEMAAAEATQETALATTAQGTEQLALSAGETSGGMSAADFARNQLQYMQNTMQTAQSTPASFSNLNPRNVLNTVQQVQGGKVTVEHSGSFSGNSGYLGIRRPYLIIERPNMCLPKNYGALNGYPSMITMTLGDCVGFTRVQQVQLHGVTATNPEQAEILGLLKGGVVF